MIQILIRLVSTYPFDLILVSFKRVFLTHKLFVFGGFQEDVFQLIGVPLVKNALSGYNTSILSYGQVIFGIYQYCLDEYLYQENLLVICV